MEKKVDDLFLLLLENLNKSNKKLEEIENLVLHLSHRLDALNHQVVSIKDNAISLQTTTEELLYNMTEVLPKYPKTEVTTSDFFDLVSQESIKKNELN